VTHLKTRIEQHSRLTPVELNIDSNPANLAMAREAVEKLCKSAGFDENAIHEIGLCVNEAHANVIRHAYDNAIDKPIQIRAMFDGQQVIIALRDWGNGVNPTELPPGKRDPLVPGGLGLVCMEKMLDEARFEPQPDGMLLTMRRRRVRT
jgi:anti-sigma regulatory factor (Ser/Thr protein kinase)